MDIVTMVIAVIGAVTGVLGCVFSFITIWSTKRNLKITFVDAECVFFPKLSTLRMQTAYHAFARVIIENRSSLPITIIDMKFGAPGKGERIPNQKYEFDVLSLPERKDDSPIVVTTFDIGKKQIFFPLTLDPYQAINGYLFFPFWPYEDEKDRLIPVHTKTTRHKRAFNISCRFFKFLPTNKNDIYFPEAP